MPVSAVETSATPSHTHMAVARSNVVAVTCCHSPAAPQAGSHLSGVWCLFFKLSVMYLWYLISNCMSMVLVTWSTF